MQVHGRHLPDRMGLKEWQQIMQIILDVGWSTAEN